MGQGEVVVLMFVAAVAIFWGAVAAVWLADRRKDRPGPPPGR